MAARRSGGIGRRAGLKIRCPKGRVGSIPTFGIGRGRSRSSPNGVKEIAMRTKSIGSRPRRVAGLGMLAVAAALLTTGAAQANVPLTLVSSDPFTNASSQHQTEVEPDTFANGSTIVATFQVGRFYDGGASNIGWATSTNGGSTWTNGFLPGITTFASPAGSYDRVSDPSVAYDAKHAVWLINSLPLTNGGGVAGVATVVSRSTNGGTTWGNPVIVATASGNSDFDKNWIACD